MIRGMAERTAAETVDQRVDDLLLRMTLAEEGGDVPDHASWSAPVISERTRPSGCRVPST